MRIRLASLKTIILSAGFGAVIAVTTGCMGGPSVIPFQPEKTRVGISATPEEVASILEANFEPLYLAKKKELYAEFVVKDAKVPVQHPLAVAVSAESHIRFYFDSQNGNPYLPGGWMDFPYAMVDGGISLVSNGETIVMPCFDPSKAQVKPGSGISWQTDEYYAPQGRGHLQSKDEEGMVRGILLDVKSKAEELHARNRSK